MELAAYLATIVTVFLAAVLFVSIWWEKKRTGRGRKTSDSAAPAHHSE